MKIMLFLITVATALVAAASSFGADAADRREGARLGTINTPMTLKVKPGAMVVDVDHGQPGGNFGWHTHGAPVAVVVTSGTLTVFDPSIGECAPFKVSKGQAFIEPANHVHLARNDTRSRRRCTRSILGIPKGVQANKPAAQPAGCDA